MLNKKIKATVILLGMYSGVIFADGSVDITADKSEIQKNLGLFTFEGSVEATIGTDFIKSEYLQINKIKSNITATGSPELPVVFDYEGSTGSAQNLSIDQTSGTMILSGGSTLSTDDTIIKSKIITYNKITDTLVAGSISKDGTKQRVRIIIKN